jgi:hypothetical protein
MNMGRTKQSVTLMFSDLQTNSLEAEKHFSFHLSLSLRLFRLILKYDVDDDNEEGEGELLPDSSWRQPGMS